MSKESIGIAKYLDKWMDDNEICGRTGMVIDTEKVDMLINDLMTGKLGHKLVPVDATKAMRKAGRDTKLADGKYQGHEINDIYKAMLEAAE